MFGNLDKKIITILFIIVVILIGGFLLYQYSSDTESNLQNSTGGAQTEQSQDQNIQTPDVQLEAQDDGGSVQGNGDGVLTVCSDKCDDGACQKGDIYCTDNLNCVCPETPESCPQDCK